jgi:hypothetical protein
MSGYNSILFLEKLRERCDALGFLMCYPKFAGTGDLISVKPKDKSLPLYARDAELFTGTCEELEVWIRGITWARDYDAMLMGAKNNKKRALKESLILQQELVDILSKDKVEQH